MIFKDKYTTVAIKEAILADKNISIDDKAKEEKKLIVSNDTYLNAEMQQELLTKMECVCKDSLVLMT
jgi:hypothetical protein